MWLLISSISLGHRRKNGGGIDIVRWNDRGGIGTGKTEACILLGESQTIRIVAAIHVGGQRLPGGVILAVVAVRDDGLVEIEAGEIAKPVVDETGI